jgi:hypothetical protein
MEGAKAEFLKGNAALIGMTRKRMIVIGNGIPIQVLKLAQSKHWSVAEANIITLTKAQGAKTELFKGDAEAGMAKKDFGITGKRNIALTITMTEPHTPSKHKSVAEANILTMTMRDATMELLNTYAAVPLEKMLNGITK